VASDGAALSLEKLLVIASRSLFEDVANSTHCVDQFDAVRIIDFRSQSTNMHIHDVRVAVKVHVPHLFGDHRTRQDFFPTA